MIRTELYKISIYKGPGAAKVERQIKLIARICYFFIDYKVK
jgi:hypothetical protein